DDDADGALDGGAAGALIGQGEFNLDVDQLALARSGGGFGIGRGLRADQRLRLLSRDLFRSRLFGLETLGGIVDFRGGRLLRTRGSERERNQARRGDEHSNLHLCSPWPSGATAIGAMDGNSPTAMDSVGAIGVTAIESTAID